MKKIYLPFLFLLFVLSSIHAQFDGALAEALQSVLDAEVDTSNVIGISVAVIHPDEGLWVGASGEATPGDALTSDHLFFAASNTKTFMAALMLQFQEEGILDLDDPYTDFVAELEYVPADITIRQLLNHSSGLYNYTDNPLVFDDAFEFLDSIFPPQVIFDDYIGAPNFEAGTDWGYSNTNFTLLGLVAESLMQEPLHTQLRDRFFDPLELNDTYLGAYEDFDVSTVGGLYLDVNGDGSLDDLSFLPYNGLLSGAWAAGGIVSRPHDLVTWVQKLHNGEILSEASLAEMREITPFSQDMFSYYGLGMQTVELLDCQFYGHTGGLIHSSVMMYAPEENVGIVVMINHGDYNLQAFLFLAETLKNFVVDVSELDAQGSKIIAFPNPTIGAIQFEMELSSPGFVKLEILSQLGQQVALLVDEPNQAAGYFQQEWDASDLAAGLYYYRLQTVDGVSLGEFVKE